MNFLAHLYLCDQTDGARLGALYGDFMRGYRMDQFPVEIQNGIRLHQHIDVFTDQHSVFRRSKRRIPLVRRRYSSVLIDIFYDHFLALHWSEYSPQTLDAFTQEVYRLLARHQETLPDRLRQITPHLIREDWLMGYLTEAGLDRTFRRLSRRIRRENHVANAIDDLKACRHQLDQDFCQFFPNLVQSVDQYRTSIAAQ